MGATPNPNTTQNVTSTTELPPWYQDVLSGMLQTGGQLSQTPYTPYTGQQVAGFTPAQDAAFGQIEGGAANPNYGLQGAAIGSAENAAGTNPLAAAASPIMQGLGYGQAGANLSAQIGYGAPNTIQSGLGAAGQGLGYTGQAANASYAGANAAAPYLQAATQPTGLEAASPYLGAASGNWTQNASSYMNPYVTNANDALAQQAATNLQEFILPSVQSQFVSAGQGASPQQANFEANILNQTQQSLLNQQSANLNNAYNAGASTYESDAARQAALAGTAGGLGTSQQQAELQAGTGLGGLTQSGTSALLGAGQTAGQLGLGTSQVGLGAGQLGTQGLLGAGQLGVSGGTALGNAATSYGNLQNQTAQDFENLGTTNQNQAITGAAALNAIGSQQQQQGQTSLNTAYQNFLNQQQYPYQQLGFYSNIVHGLPVTTNTTTQTAGPATTSQLQPNILSQLAGAGAGIGALTGGGGNATGGTTQGVNLSYKRGGMVSDSRRKASYGRTPTRGLGFAMAS